MGVIIFTELTTQLLYLRRKRQWEKNIQEGQIRIAVGGRNRRLNTDAVQIDQAHLLRQRMDQNISRMQITLDHPLGVESLQKSEDRGWRNAGTFIDPATSEPLSDQDAFLQAPDIPALTQGRMADGGNSQ